MNWTEIITIILGSSVLSTLLDIGYNSYQDNKKNEKKREEKLYNRLKFYLILIEKLESMQNIILEEKNKEIKSALNTSTNTQLQAIEAPFYNLENKVKQDWEKYAEIVLNLLEQNIQYLKPEHLLLVSDIFENYFYQKIIYGEKVEVDLKKIKALTSKLRTGKAMQFSLAIKNLRDTIAP